MSGPVAKLFIIELNQIDHSLNLFSASPNPFNAQLNHFDHHLKLSRTHLNLFHGFRPAERIEKLQVRAENLPANA